GSVFYEVKQLVEKEMSISSFPFLVKWEEKEDILMVNNLFLPLEVAVRKEKLSTRAEGRGNG
ncbi:hypothetical protein JTE90_021593, partial [Oedothorax gibbosus]